MSVDEIKALPIRNQVEIIYDMTDDYFSHVDKEFLLNFKPILIALKEVNKMFDTPSSKPYLISTNFREDRIECVLKHKLIKTLIEEESKVNPAVRKTFGEWLNSNDKVTKRTFNNWLSIPLIKMV